MIPYGSRTARDCRNDGPAAHWRSWPRGGPGKLTTDGQAFLAATVEAEHPAQAAVSVPVEDHRVQRRPRGRLALGAWREEARAAGRR